MTNAALSPITNSLLLANEGLICAWPHQPAAATSLYLDGYCEQHPELCDLPYSADYDLVDLDADLNWSWLA